MRPSRVSLSAAETQAASWLARRESGLPAAEQAEFEAWVRASPEHAAAVSELERVWAAFDRPVALGRQALIEGMLGSLERRDRRRRQAYGLGVTLAVASLAVYFGIRPVVHRASDPIVLDSSAVRIIQPDHQTLPDGTRVELKPGSEIAVAYGPAVRRVILKHGEAHFSVAKNPKWPFIVQAAGVEIRAVGTAFAVGLGTSQVEVLVTEGKVSVDHAQFEHSHEPGAGPANPVAFVAAGSRLVVGVAPAPSIHLQPSSVSPSEIEEHLAWRVPQLDFSDAPLSAAAGLFNRNNDPKISFADDSTAGLRVTGVFRSNNVEGFVRALQSSLHVHAERSPDGSFVLSAVK